MSYLKSWISFGEKMEIGECEEVYYWEHAIYPGYTEDICFLLRKIDKDTFSLSMATPRSLAAVGDVEVEDEDDYMAIRNWYVENGEYDEEKPEMEYPVNIVYITEDGEETVTINSAEEMEAAKREGANLSDGQIESLIDMNAYGH